MLLVHKDTTMIRYKGDSKAIFDQKKYYDYENSSKRSGSTYYRRSNFGPLFNKHAMKENPQK